MLNNEEQSPLALTKQTYNANLPKGKAYAAGQAAGTYLNEGVKQAGTDIGNGINGLAPLVKPTVDAIKAPIEQTGASLGVAAGMTKVGADEFLKSKQENGSMFGNAGKSIANFGRGLVGAEPLQQTPAATINAPQQAPTAKPQALSLAALPVSVQKDLPPSPAIPAQINNAIAQAPQQQQQPVQQAPQPQQAKPTQAIGINGSVPTPQQQQQPKQPKETVLSGWGQIGNPTGERIGLNGAPYPKQQVEQQQPRQQASTNYRDYIDPTVANWVNPLEQETGIDANYLPRGMFGGLAGLMMAQAAMMPAHAQNKRAKYLQEQYSKARDVAIGRADKEADKQAAQATAQRQAYEKDRDYDLNSRKNEFDERKSLLQLAAEQEKEKNNFGLAKRKQSAEEDNNYERNRIYRDNVALGRDRLANDQKRLELSEKQASKGIVQMQDIYGEPDVMGVSHKIGEKPILIDPYSGMITEQ